MNPRALARGYFLIERSDSMSISYNKLLHAVMDIGEAMQNSGAEISRVEDSINRMCAAYGVRRVNSFTITGNIIVTLEVDDETVITQTRRTHQPTSDFTRLDKLNDLSRYICANLPEVEEIKARYEAIMAHKPLSRKLTYLGGVLTAGGFTAFFGGNTADVLAASVLALLVETLMLRPIRQRINPLFYLTISAFFTGLGGSALVRLGLGDHLDTILIGCIMLTIPGLAITNAIRDLLSGDTFSGLSRLCESLLLAAGIACGFSLAIYLMGRGI